MWLLEKILSKDLTYKDNFALVFDNIENYTMATKVACIITLYPLYKYSRKYTLDILRRIINDNLSILKSNYVQEFIRKTASVQNYDYYENLFSDIQVEDSLIRTFIAGLFTHYGLIIKNAQITALQFIDSGIDEHRKEAAKVFSQYAKTTEVVSTDFYQQNFEKLINDNNTEVAETRYSSYKFYGV